MNLEELESLDFTPDALGRLILPKEKKQLLVRAIESVQKQTEYPRVVPDATKLIPGSNMTDRLFLLLHGSPGTGKSLAAQCLANHARRPLFLVTSGMKAGEATFVDFLRTVFKLAKQWKCLVLMERMDIVVERLAMGKDLERNAIVNGRPQPVCGMSFEMLIRCMYT